MGSRIFTSCVVATCGNVAYFLLFNLISDTTPVLLDSECCGIISAGTHLNGHRSVSRHCAVPVVVYLTRSIGRSLVLQATG